MPEDQATTEYREKLMQVMEVPAPDNLVLIGGIRSAIKLTVAGTYSRGEVLMSNGNNEFQTATSAGISSANEICILIKDCDVPEGSEVYTAGYFGGTFNSDDVVFSFESEPEEHEMIVEQVKPAMRKRGLDLN